MAETLTTNFGWIKPEIQGSPSTWGGFLNQDLDAIDALVFSNQQGLSPIGSGAIWFTATPPANWLLCNGQALATTGTYAALFAVIGYTYGGSGANFNLPNFAGRFPIGQGGNGAVLAGTGGAMNTSIAVTNLPQHAHTITDVAHNHVLNQAPHAHGDPGHTHGVNDPGHAHTGVARQTGNPNILAGQGAPVFQASSTDVHTTGVSLVTGFTGIQAADANISINASGTGLSTTDAAGGNTPLPVIPPFLGLNFIIRFQ